MVLALVGLNVAAFPVRSHAATIIALPNCLGKPEVRPSSIIFSCADGYFRVENLKWTGWGEGFAAASGTAVLNDCEPYCARGHFHNYPMLVTASGRQKCPNGLAAYEKVVYAFVGRSPYPTNNAEDAVFHFPCRPMP